MIKDAHPVFLKSLKLINSAAYLKYKTDNINFEEQRKEQAWVLLRKYSLVKKSQMPSCSFKQMLRPYMTLWKMFLKMLVFRNWLSNVLRIDPGSFTVTISGNRCRSVKRAHMEPNWPQWFLHRKNCGLERR